MSVCVCMHAHAHECMRACMCTYVHDMYVHACRFHLLLFPLTLMYMIKSCTCICKGGQDKVRHSPKADSEKKNTELPWTGFEPVTTGLLVQCSAN